MGHLSGHLPGGRIGLGLEPPQRQPGILGLAALNEVVQPAGGDLKRLLGHGPRTGRGDNGHLDRARQLRQLLGQLGRQGQPARPREVDGGWSPQ
ncbi:MAG: hypothetical protein ACK559_20150, partial [bacterium]